MYVCVLCVGYPQVITDTNAPHSTSLVYEFASAGPLMCVSMGECEADQYYAVQAPSFTVAGTDTHFTEHDAGSIFWYIFDVMYVCMYVCVCVVYIDWALCVIQGCSWWCTVVFDL
jgi:hypothetical protein